MSGFLALVAVFAALGVVGALFAGLFVMARGRDKAASNRWMRQRVLLQAIAIVLFLLALYLAGLNPP
jgi:NADH:ubiquinone oxidoreductase subunit 6 (subunit J)